MAGAVIFRMLSRIVGVVLIVLIASPVTAPFSTFDFATDASQFENGIKDTESISVATPVASVNASLPNAFDLEMLAPAAAQLHAAGNANVAVLRL